MDYRATEKLLQAFKAPAGRSQPSFGTVEWSKQAGQRTSTYWTI